MLGSVSIRLVKEDCPLDPKTTRTVSVDVFPPVREGSSS